MRADERLDELGYTYEKVVQEQPTEACDAAARERGVRTGQIVKSLIVQTDGDEKHLLVPGDRQVSERKLGDYGLVEPERSTALTGCEPGTVHPFSSDLPHLVDYRLFRNDRVSFTVGSRTEGVIIAADSFKAALDDASIEWKERDIVSYADEDKQDLEPFDIDDETATFLAKEGYNRVFRLLQEQYDQERLIMAIESLHREAIIVSAEMVEGLLDRADGETHMQRLTAQYAEHEEWPEETSFDLDTVLQEVLENNEEAVTDYQAGKSSALNFLMGQVMNETQGQANPSTVRSRLEDALAD